MAAGLLSGMFGVGGGLLIVPGLTLLLGFGQRLAHGTSLAAILPISLSGVTTYWLAGNVDWSVGGWLSVGAIVGALVGTRLLQVVPHRALVVGFTIVLLATAVRLFLPAEAGGRTPLDAGAAIGLVAVGLVAGTLAGLLGVGGGIVMVPAMVVLFGVPSVVAKGTSVAVIIPTSVMGTLRNRRARNADLDVGWVVGVAGVVSAALGAVIANEMSESVSNALFAALLAVVAVRQLVDLRAAARRGDDGAAPIGVADLDG